MPASEEITALLQSWSKGDKQALEKLTPVLYKELHRMAHRYMRQERAGHTLQTTALINEAYLRLIGWKNVRWQNRAQSRLDGRAISSTGLQDRRSFRLCLRRLTESIEPR